MNTAEWLRPGIFLLAFVVIALWEAWRPARVRAHARGARWPHNLALLAVDAALVRMALPGAVIAVAALAGDRGWGLLGYLDLPFWLELVIALLLLDLVLYFQHVMFHAVPALWRLHRVHHSDTDFDLTTGIRFHPIEILLSTVIKMAAVAAIGAAPLAVLVFEIVVNAMALFNHANARLPAWLEPVVRAVLVTPDMHRVHHSVRYNESASNFGFNVSWWDRMFGTWRCQPAMPHESMLIGVDAFRVAEELRLDRLLAQPWRDTPGGYSINRRPEPENA